MKKVTLRKLAAEAGVSQATLSRIVNHTTNVSDELRLKVEKAAETLGVSLSDVSHKHKYNHSRPKIVGLVVADLSNPYFQVVMRGVMTEAQLLDYGVQLFETNEDVHFEEEMFKKIKTYQLDGLILCASRILTSHLIDFQNQTRIPMVLINRYVKNPDIRCIVIDYEKALFQATSHLINLGHRRIAFLSGPSTSETSKFRRSGILKAMKQHGLDLKPGWSPGCSPNVEGGFQAMISLLALPENQRPTAVLAYNDLVAIGALQAIRLRGFRVPEDISLIGVDNIDITAHTYPPLTTIAPPKVHMGSIAMRTIDTMRKGDYVPSEGYVEIEAPLILRYSTGPVMEKQVINSESSYFG